jgi:hypothetical protein
MLIMLSENGLRQMSEAFFDILNPCELRRAKSAVLSARKLRTKDVGSRPALNQWHKCSSVGRARKLARQA